MAGEIQDVERQLEYLWSNFTTTPQIMGMSLGNIRKAGWAKKDEDIQEFLAKTTDLPDTSVVVINSMTDVIAVYEEKEYEVMLAILKGGVP
jgi:hypothetical protein